MYLKEITINGFKSFADKTDLKLDNKITCIVGPNGSGKSNIVDAVRWVLGEQSVKSLRGDNSMSDIIFSGSKSRKPLNVASVELIFDNTDHLINVPYTEISIKRRVYRTGENEYFLNHEKCRLKDINNLLMDTGMSKASFNIISQGEVDKILSNSSLDRRVIFEEASGILKYKKRKEEALKRLDKTHNNLDRVGDIIKELEDRLTPLKEQRDKAIKYKENKSGLDKYEVSLLSYDITTLNNASSIAKDKKKALDDEILNLSTTSNVSSSKKIEYDKTLSEKEEELSHLQKELLKVTEDAASLEGEKKLLEERAANSKEDEVSKKVRNLLEEKESLNKDSIILDERLKSLKRELDSKDSELSEVNKTITSKRKEKDMYTATYSRKNQEAISLQNKIESLKREIEEGGDLPNSVRKVLNNKELSGIYSNIGSVVETDGKYAKALNIALGGSKNFIIVKDEFSAKEAINYLKDERAGRATFFPLSVIKERYVDSNTLSIIKSSPDFIGVMSDLVTYNPIYKNIIKNQLGMILVSPDIDSATRLSKLINRRYRVVTLDGDVVNVGGSLSGGSYNAGRSIVLLKQDLSSLKEKYNLLKEDENTLTTNIETLNNTISTLEDKLFTISKEKVTKEEEYTKKKEEYNTLLEKISSAEKEYSSYLSISNNNIDEEEEKLIKEYNEKIIQKENIKENINTLNKEITTLKDKIEQSLAEEKLNNNTLHTKEKLSKELEIEINRIDVKLDNLLERLSTEYSMTYEKAKTEYSLDIEPDEARGLVSKYKNNIKEIGMVNLSSIEEYDSVNTRYEFLNNEKNDLLKAEDSLLEIMNEMDGVMKEEFKNTFEAIRVEFQKVFRELFMGGHADLKLTDPDNLLETGVDIVASPPGKRLTSISLLSGGEKTLTAISLLFAILNVRQIPFCLFDEVEAALDEANVSEFGKYLNNYKDKTQFLIITHKKKTMEYANTLYGITMQESGVSKLVSVRLEDHPDVI